MASKSNDVVVIEDDELEDGEIEDDLEEFNEYERLFDGSESSFAESRKLPSSNSKSKSKRSNTNNNAGSRRERVRNRSQSSRSGHRRDRSKSLSSKGHGVVSKKHGHGKKTSPVSTSTSSKRSRLHSSSKRRTSAASASSVSGGGSDMMGFAKGLRQRAAKLRRMKREQSPPKPTMRYLLYQNDQRHPGASTSSISSKKRRDSEMEEYEKLLQKHREVQEAISEVEANLKVHKPDDKVFGMRRQRSRSRSGSQSSVKEVKSDKSTSKETSNEIPEVTIDDDSDDDMDELQLRMLALQSATRAVAAREEKENQEELLMEIETNTAASTASRARQEERKQKLARWKKQHSLTVEMNKAPDEEARYQLFMQHMSRSTESKKTSHSTVIQNGHQASTSSQSTKRDVDSDDDIQEIPVTRPAIKEIVIPDTMEGDNYEAVEMELDTEESSFTPPIPGIQDGPDVTMPLMKEEITQEILPHTTTSHSSQPPPPGVSPVKIFPPSSLPHQEEIKDDKNDDEDDDDEEEMVALRHLLLQSMAAKKAAKKQQQKGQVDSEKVKGQQPLPGSSRTREDSPEVSSGTASPVTITSALKQLRQAAMTTKAKPQPKPKIPVHKPVIIRPGDDSDDSEDEKTSSSSIGLSGLDMFLKEARKTADKKAKSTSTHSSSSHSKSTKREPTTPEAMTRFPDSHRAEYQRLKQEIVRREQKKQSSSAPGSGTASPDPTVVGKSAPKGVQVTSKSTNKTSAATSSSSSEVKPKKQMGKEKKQSTSSEGMNKEAVSLKRKQDAEALARQQAQKKEIKTSTEKLLKHRQAIEKGHKLLRSLDVQIDRKGKVVDLMQMRVKKLKEELLAAQKMAGEQQDQVQKFEEQKQQVRNRLQKHVKEEKQLHLKLTALKGEAVPNQSATSSLAKANGTKSVIGAKRPLEPSTSVASPNKKSKLLAASSKTNSKSDPKLQELQKLERAYAQKIEQLKQDQAKKAQVKMSHLSPAAHRLMKLRKSMPNVKPAKQVYLKDKIALGNSSGNSSGEESGGKTKRRRSWLDGTNPVLTPNLMEEKRGMKSTSLMRQKQMQPSSTTPKKLTKRRTSRDSDKGTASPVKTASSSGKKQEQKASKAPPEPIVDGLFMPNTQQLKLLQQIQAEKSHRGIDFVALSQSFDVFQREVTVAEEGFDVRNVMKQYQDGVDEEDGADDVLPLTGYTSPLIPFKAYRLSSHFERGSHMTRHSTTVSNKIHPMRPFCKYELNGKCNDEECLWQHERDYLLSELELYEDLSSYMQLKSSEAKNANMDKFDKELDKMMKLIDKEKDSGRIDVQKRKMEMGRVCVERVRKCMQGKGLSVLLEPRKRPRQYLKSSKRGETSDRYPLPELPRKQAVNKPDTLTLEDTERYFFKASEGVMDLEAAVLERPQDIELWLKLAYKQLADDSNEKNLDKALYALCRGLETNKSSSVLWLHYLSLYEQRNSHPDLLQLCQQAVEFAPDYQIWWKYLTLKPSFAEKDSVCEKLLEFVQEQQKEDKTEEGSHRLFETLLYRVQLYITTRRVSQGLNIFQDALREYSISSLCRHLFPKDRRLAWLAYLHAMAFHCLPSCLFEPSIGAMGRLTSKEPFMFPWNQAESSRLSESLITGFQDALLSCSSSQLPIEDSIEICLPIYQNLFTLEAKLDRLSKAQSVCRHLVHDCPSSSQLWLCLVDIETKNKCSTENIAKVYEEALAACPTSAELYYHAAKFELDNDRKDEAIRCLTQCASRYYDVDSTQESNSQDITNLFRSLLNQHLPFDYKPPALAEDISTETIDHNLLHLWSCYCLYLEKSGESHDLVSEAYETGLCALKNTQDVQKLWMIYLKYKKSQLTSTGESATQSWKAFTDLVNRCLISMATVWPLPHSSTDTWLDFSFHNRVLELYMSCVRGRDTVDAFLYYMTKMPRNISLAFWGCQHAIDSGHEFQAQLIARAVLSQHPTCVPFWKIAVAMCVKNGQTKEAEQMYQRAVEACPLSASLWKDYLLFEVTRGKSCEELKKLIVRCRDDLGLNINDYLETIFKT